MRTLTFAVAMLATASHAETIDSYLDTLRGEGVSSVHDVTALIWTLTEVQPAFQCSPLRQSPTYYRACREFERGKPEREMRLLGLRGRDDPPD